MMQISILKPYFLKINNRIAIRGSGLPTENSKGNSITMLKHNVEEDISPKTYPLPKSKIYKIHSAGIIDVTFLKTSCPLLILTNHIPVCFCDSLSNFDSHCLLELS